MEVQPAGGSLTDSTMVAEAPKRSRYCIGAAIGAGVITLIVVLVLVLHVHGFPGGAPSGPLPKFPKAYSAVILMSLPYIPMETSLRVLVSNTSQRLEFYNGLQIQTKVATGSYTESFNNSQRQCLFTPDTAGPTMTQSNGAQNAVFEPDLWLPDLSQYTREADELVGGILCHKYSLSVAHGSLGTMNDHISFYWDSILEKPVRWHFHSRHPIFHSHTDEYIMDFISFVPGMPRPEEMKMSRLCDNAYDSAPRQTSSGLEAFLTAAQSLYMSSSDSTKSHSLREGLQANLQMIDNLNEKHAGHTSFRGNRFVGMTKEQFLSFRGGFVQAQPSEDHQKWVFQHKSSGKTLPKDFDWRSAKPGGVVSEVKDQAFCGSCWTFATTEPIESAVAIQTGEMTLLPEQFILDCTWKYNANGGCFGGNSNIGVLEVVRKFGGVIPTAKAYGKYLSVNGYCKDISRMEVGARVTGWVDVKPDDDEVRDALVTKGPLSIGIMVPDEMVYYDSGVLSVDSCLCNATKIDHAVVLVGYGSDEKGTDYWLVRNSWSTYWGDQGYIKIARGKNDCCISAQSGYAQVETSAKSTIEF